MSIRGTVRNGVVVLEPGSELPEGTAVRVEAEITPTPHEPTEQRAEMEDSLLRMLDYAGPTGIPDLAVNADHYLYGHPKVTDG